MTPSFLIHNNTGAFMETVITSHSRGKLAFKTIIKQKQLILMSLPFIIYIFIFNYLPIWGWTMAFQDFKVSRSFFEQKWVGLKHFKSLFTDDRFLLVIRNTLAMSIIGIILGFVTSIAFAIFLNEFKNIMFKRTIQTISYIPHFVSWSVVAGLVQLMLAPQTGAINELLQTFHLIDKPIMWLGEGKYFWGIIGITGVWKEMGWNAIVYLAAIASINPSLYESAEMDGAGRYRKILHITLPGLKTTFIILLIMNIGNLIRSGFELQYLLQNAFILDYSEVIQIYVLDYGLRAGNYSFGTAAGLFQSVVAIILVLSSNFISKKVLKYGII